MTWARFDDGFCQHPKVVGLSDAAFRLHVAGVCYSARNLMDGKIARSALVMLTQKPRAASIRRADELVDAGVWERDECGCYRIHDYLDYNPSRAAVNSKRDSKAMAGAKGAASRWHDGKNAPVPVPVPVPVIPHAPVRAGEAIGWYERTVGRSARNPTLVQILEDIDAAHPPDCIAAVFKKSSAAAEPWPYAKRIFDACLMSGHEPKERTNGAYKPGDSGGHGRGERGAAGADRERSRPLTEAERVAAIAELERVDQEIRAAGATAGAVE